MTGLNTDNLQTEGVEFTGRLSDQALNQEIVEAKFLISPSLYEGAGLLPYRILSFWLAHFIWTNLSTL